MEHNMKYLLATMLFGVMITGCKKPDDDPIIPPPPVNE